MSWQPVVSKKKPWIKQFKSLHLIYIYDFRPHKTYPRFLFGVSSTRHYYTHLISTIGCSVVIDRSFDPCLSIICGTLSVHDIASQSLIMMKKKQYREFWSKPLTLDDIMLISSTCDCSNKTSVNIWFRITTRDTTNAYFIDGYI